MFTPRPIDTSPGAERVQFELLRKMSAEERLALMTRITLAVQRLAFAGLRSKYPDASEDEIWLRLAVQRLGADRVSQIYGWRPDHQ